MLEMIRNKDQELEAKLTTLFEKMCGTPEYWSTRNKELNCIIRELGPFTLWFTVSAAEFDWEDMERIFDRGE